MEGEKGGDKVAMETVWNILEEVIELLDSRTEVTISLCVKTPHWECVEARASDHEHGMVGGHTR